jgi:TetR/AcrR family fatty acid metabolism transcriptional regulator
MLRRLTDRSIAHEDKRRLILEAAVRVFARKGYHTCRVGDIAEEAGVAYGRHYHNFNSPEELLETVVRETWPERLGAIRDVEDSGLPAREQLRQVVAILLRSWRRDPDLVRVLVREIARSPDLQHRIGELGQAFAAIARIVERGQAEGEFRPELDPRFTSYVVYGALEAILTGWVLEQLPDGDEEVARAERALLDVVSSGLEAARAPAAT